MYSTYSTYSSYVQYEICSVMLNMCDQVFFFQYILASKLKICRGKYSECSYFSEVEREKTGPSKGYAGSNICSSGVLNFLVFNYICEAKVAKC